ncbi:hypothetical protein WME76_02340 [Sorangium sp. So ce119]|uniref:hypothetical protein n=1 Tax=Sorangium sp. So ce119 TaxID=3133279 RepID=UPI003F60DBC5
MAQYSGNDTFPASAELVNDGTVRDAASVNVLVEAALDRAVYLRNVGFRRLSTWIIDDDGAAGVWFFTSAAPTYAPTITNPTTDWLATVNNTRVGDILQIDVVADASVGAATTAQFRVGVTDNFGSGTEAHAPGFASVATSTNRTMTISTYHTVTAAGTSRVRLLARRYGSGSVELREGGSIRVVLLRPSGSTA